MRRIRLIKAYHKHLTEDQLKRMSLTQQLALMHPDDRKDEEIYLGLRTKYD